MVKASSPEGGVVLDPFLGSGTTAVACILNKRHYVGFEINKEYCEMIKKRINGKSTNNHEIPVWPSLHIKFNIHVQKRI